jgi:hypothetical protein
LVVVVVVRLEVGVGGGEGEDELVGRAAPVLDGDVAVAASRKASVGVAARRVRLGRTGVSAEVPEVGAARSRTGPQRVGRSAGFDVVEPARTRDLLDDGAGRKVEVLSVAAVRVVATAILVQISGHAVAVMASHRREVEVVGAPAGVDEGVLPPPFLVGVGVVAAAAVGGVVASPARYLVVARQGLYVVGPRGSYERVDAGGARAGVLLRGARRANLVHRERHPAGRHERRQHHREQQ